MTHLFFRLFFVIAGMGLLASCTSYPGIPASYHQMLDQAMVKAGINATELKQALNEAPAQQKEAMAFLIAHMPETDLKEMKSAFLLENVATAYMAREKFEWAKEIPDSIFFNDVLPYASMNERRDNWRADFMNRFTVYVEGCSDIKSAIDSVNKHIRDELKVDYNTRRKKPDQSPYESMEQGMASCSGLSILLTDAFRAVGIPSRIAGTPNWHDNRGNHNWNEVWIDGQWYFTEYYPSGLNQSWFLADAGKATPDDATHAIYATSWKPAGTIFPLVWDSTITWVNGENVTLRYIDIYNQENKKKEQEGNMTILKVMMFKNKACTLQGDDRVAVNVDIFSGPDQIGGGRTAGPTQDMNDVLEIKVEKNKTYKLLYQNAKQQLHTEEFPVGDEPATVKLFME